MSYRMKELNLDDQVRVGRAAPIIGITRGSLFDTFVLEMNPPLLNGNRAIVCYEMHVRPVR
jgi:hypothetical protein